MLISLFHYIHRIRENTRNFKEKSQSKLVIQPYVSSTCYISSSPPRDAKQISVTTINVLHSIENMARYISQITRSLSPFLTMPVSAAYNKETINFTFYSLRNMTSFPGLKASVPRFRASGRTGWWLSWLTQEETLSCLQWVSIVCLWFIWRLFR
jgi:hypothetical protein